MGQFFEDRQGSDGFVQFLVAVRVNGTGADGSQSTQVSVIGHVADDRGVSGRFMDDIRCGCVFDVIELTDIRCDHQHPEGLVFHEGGGRNEAIHGDGAPSDCCQCIIDLLHRRNPFDGETGLFQSGDVWIVSRILEVAVILPHHVTPDGMVDGRVAVVWLGDDVSA